MNRHASFSPAPMMMSFVFGEISSMIWAALRKLVRWPHSDSMLTVSSCRRSGERISAAPARI